MKSKQLRELNRFLKKLGVTCRKKFIPELYQSLDIKSADTAYAIEIIQYYKELGFGNFTPLLHLFLEQKIHVRSKHFLPDELRDAVMRVMNGHDRNKYIDKNMYPLIVKTTRQPKNIVRNVNGSFFDQDNHSLKISDALRLLEENVEHIVKPSLSSGGSKVGRCFRQNDKILLNGSAYSFNDFTKIYGFNFTIQEKLKQSSIVGQIHPESINTLRLVTLRWNDKIHYLMGFLRAGSGAVVNDNASTGGICVGLSETGILNSYAVDKTGKVMHVHPTTGFDFQNNIVQMPNFEKFKEFVISLHMDVLHHHLVSWDIAVGTDQLPVFIEHNFAGQFWIYQFATGKPLFGKYSDEILNHIALHDRYVTLNPTFRIKRIGPLRNDELIKNTKLFLASLLNKL